MNVFLDTNILISAVLNSNSTPAKAFIKAVSFPNRGLVCEQNIDEMRRIFNRKFPAKIQALETFLSLALLTLEMVNIPDLEYKSENSIRDVNDRAILRAAIFAKADFLVTGDKDFLESDIFNPKILTAAEFLDFESKK